MRPRRRICVPIGCVSALRARGMSGQAQSASQSFFRRPTAPGTEMTSPWSRPTQSFFRQPTALALAMLTTNPWSRPLPPRSTTPWRRPRTSGSQTRALASMCHPATKSVLSRLWRKRQGREIATGAHQRPLSVPGDLGKCASESGCGPCLVVCRYVPRLVITISGHASVVGTQKTWRYKKIHTKFREECVMP